jgi:hypothetical protein
MSAPDRSVHLWARPPSLGRFVGLAACLVCVCALMLPGSGGATTVPRPVLLGSQTLKGHAAYLRAGDVDAFALRATKSGDARVAFVYAGLASHAEALTIAVYADHGGRPGRRLTAGSRHPLRRGKWDLVRIAPVELLARHTYWLALLATGGRLEYRDASSCRKNRALLHRRSRMPVRWPSNSPAPSCRVSAYLAGSVSTGASSPTNPNPPGSGPPGSGTGSSPGAPPGPVGWPNATDTGAIAAPVTQTMPGTGMHTVGDGEVDNTRITGGIYYTGNGTLTLRNDIITADWTNTWAAVVAYNNGNLILDHVTINGVNIGQGSNFTKGFLMEGNGSLDVGYSNVSGICQDDVGSGPFDIHDSYIHDIGSGNGNTCHATAVEDESGGAEPRTVEHNTLDEFPGQNFEPATDGAVFLQGLYGAISKITIDDNYLHAADWSIEISANGNYPITGPSVTNNCLAWPSGSGPVSDPNHTISLWSGNTKCDDTGKNSGQPVPYP